MTSTSILAIGDLHFKTAEIHETLELKEFILDYIKNNSIDIVVLLGDILHDHEKLNSMVLNYASDFINDLKDIVETFVLVGNHDMYNNQVFLQPYHWMNNLKDTLNLTIVDKVVRRVSDSSNLVFCPYVPNGRFEEALDTKSNWKCANVIFAHQEIKGCKMGPFISTDGDEWSSDYPLLISGHIHDYQEFDNVLYPGSARSVGFGHTSSCQMTHVNIDNGKIDINYIKLPSTIHKTIYTDNLEDIPEINQDRKVRIILENVTSSDIKIIKKTKIYKDLVKKVKVCFKLKKESIKTSDKSDNTDSLIERIINMIQGDSLEMELFQKISVK